MLTTDQKGAIAESAIIHAAVKMNVGVYRPVVEGGRYDLVLDAGAKLLRMQCKWAPRVRGVVVIRCYSSRRAPEGFRKRAYTADEVDCIAAYCRDIDRCFLVPADRFHGHSHVQLRLVPSRNNQRRGVNWAEEFDFAARLRELMGP